jgi:hypothetical protein
MADFDINLGEVQYKPPLAASNYTFTVSKAEVEQAKEPNKRTGQREWYIKCELKPLEAPDYIVYHNWSLSMAALQVQDAVVSLKALYEVMGAVAGSRINTNDLLLFKFVGATRLDSFQGRLNPKLDKIIQKAD